jgi:hypothetical protein
MSSVKKWREFIDGVEVEVLEFEGTVETVEEASMPSGYPPTGNCENPPLKGE